MFYVTRQWELRSRLLSVRQFTADSPRPEDTRLSGILHGYLKAVLEEFGLTASDLFSATSDSGRGLGHMCRALLPGLWERCVCHVLHDALAEVRSCPSVKLPTVPCRRTRLVLRRGASRGRYRQHRIPSGAARRSGSG